MDLREKERKTVEILRALKKVNYPGYSRDIVSFGFLKKIEVYDDDRVFIDLEISTQKEEVIEQIKEKVQEEIGKIGWIKGLELSVREREIFRRQKIPIKGKTVAIYSTKGGVGKSSIATQLAYTFSVLGLKSSLLDLDVYGPSIPKMTGTQDSEPTSYDGQHIIPVEKEGVRIMSLGYMAKGDTPVIWRGPLVIKAFRTLIFSTHWPDTDVLVIDLPPGSGDIQLSLAQEVNIDGIVMVTTPQDIALEDVRRGISMYRKLEVPILGIVENMSWFTCDSCGKKHFIFGKGGGELLSKVYNMELLGQIPFDYELLELADRGKIYVLEKKNSEVAQAFLSIAKKIIDLLKISV